MKSQTGMPVLDAKDDSKKFSILLVDDEQDIAYTFEKGLEAIGPFSVHAFTDPYEALKSVADNHFHLLIIDLRMPKMNGFDFCQKTLEIDPGIAVVFITAAERYYDDYKSRYPDLNGHGFIIKPISLTNLSRFILSELGISSQNNSN